MFYLLQEDILGTLDQKIGCPFWGLKLGCGYLFEIPLDTMVDFAMLGLLELLWQCQFELLVKPNH